jgi:predicted anti-sigma-YlaC factor YlaD
MMWNLLKRTGSQCSTTQDGLERAALRNPNARTAQELVEELSSAEREHLDACSQCREAAENLASARRIFYGMASAAESERPFFASRVMAAIAAKERELAELVSPWSEVPRFATKLAWISAVLLLAGTTWFYEKHATEPPRLNNGDASQESIFEPSAPAAQDDVLISMAEAPR